MKIFPSNFWASHMVQSDGLQANDKNGDNALLML